MTHILRYFTGLVLSVIAASIQAQELNPLIETQWGQGEPYNMYSPKDSLSGRNVLAGCGPIAMAQVIRYLQQPAISPSGDKYQWALMAQQPSNQQEASAIAKLVADCGVNAFTSYGKERSGTKTINIVNALKKCFGYNPYIFIVKRDQYPGDEGRRLWRRLIMNELQANRPVIVRAQHLCWSWWRPALARSQRCRVRVSARFSILYHSDAFLYPSSQKPQADRT